MKTTWKTLLVGLIFVNLAGLGQAAPALSAAGNATIKACEQPDLSRLPQFSLQSGYLSLPGYLNYHVYQHGGNWLNLADRNAALAQQVESKVAQQRTSAPASAAR